MDLYPAYTGPSGKKECDLVYCIVSIHASLYDIYDLTRRKVVPMVLIIGLLIAILITGIICYRTENPFVLFTVGLIFFVLCITEYFLIINKLLS